MLPLPQTQIRQNLLLQEMMALRDPSQVPGLSRFFKCGPGQYGAGDAFLGIKVPVTRSVVKRIWPQMNLDSLEPCLVSPWHEVRLAALLVLVEMFRHARRDPAFRERIIACYLSHTTYINNWDLVDLSCYPLLGEWLRDKDRSLLYLLADSNRTLWERRIGMVSTMAFVRAGELDDTYALADLFLRQQPLHDLLQKAAGWLLREAGKRDEARLKAWLLPRLERMPRTMLRYAIEKFPETERQTMLRGPVM